MVLALRSPRTPFVDRDGYLSGNPTYPEFGGIQLHLEDPDCDSPLFATRYFSGRRRDRQTFRLRPDQMSRRPTSHGCLTPFALAVIRREPRPWVYLIVEFYPDNIDTDILPGYI